MFFTEKNVQVQKFLPGRGLGITAKPGDLPRSNSLIQKVILPCGNVFLYNGFGVLPFFIDYQ